MHGETHHRDGRDAAERTRHSKRIIVRDDPVAGLAGLIQAGPLLFTAGCDGHRNLATGAIDPELAAAAEAQCENAYGKIGALLRHANAGYANVVRLDHVTSSQDWLPRRQSIRGRLFGRPAPLASTGIAAKMTGINMLTAFVVAVTDSADKEVLVPGARYGMNNISSAVRGGPFLFIAGIRGNVDPRTGEAVAEETRESFPAQLRMCYDIIGAILRDVGAGPDRIVRFDSYIREIRRAEEDVQARHAVLGDVRAATTVVGLPLSARGEVEITTLAVAPGYDNQVLVEASDGLPAVIGAGGYLLVGECRGDLNADTGEFDAKLIADRSGQLDRALSILRSRLERAGSDLTRVVRLEIYLRDIYFADEASEILRHAFRGDPPVVAIMGAELEDLVEVKLNAIAV